MLPGSLTVWQGVDWLADQAEYLRQLARGMEKPMQVPRKTRLVAVVSGKGGVGKSNIALNFALALQETGLRIALLDADLGFNNLDILMGISSQFTLQDVFERRVSLRNALTEGPLGIRVLSGSTGTITREEETTLHLSRFASELHDLDGLYDRIYIDFGAGFGRHSAEMTALCDDILLVTTPEPTALADAYALVKMVMRTGQSPHVQLVMNRAHSIREAGEAAQRFSSVVERFLKMNVEILGYVLEDASVARAVIMQQPFVVGEPDSTAARCVAQLAKQSLRGQGESSDEPRGLRALWERFFRR